MCEFLHSPNGWLLRRILKVDMLTQLVNFVWKNCILWILCESRVKDRLDFQPAVTLLELSVYPLNALYSVLCCSALHCSLLSVSCLIRMHEIRSIINSSSRFFEYVLIWFKKLANSTNNREHTLYSCSRVCLQTSFRPSHLCARMLF